MTDAELNALEAKAKAATPGPWHIGDDGYGLIFFNENGIEVDNAASVLPNDAAFIAAANPAAVLDLIADLRQAQAELKLPCPHCGETHNIGQDSDKAWHIRCFTCGMRGPAGEDEFFAAAAWNALPRRLRWSKEKPTEPDFYWNRDGRLLRIGEIFKSSGALWCHFAGECEPTRLEFVSGEFAGPIPEPEEE